ncbi:MAG: carbamate kinase, partial [Planctomycetes bacterium]|nr:carbamate kinase [Planctomycetota bacterium]
HVQGGMGYMIAQTLTNELARRGRERMVTTIITTVLVDRDDPSFANPTKPIGRVLTREEAEGYQRDQGWHVKEISPGTYRRIVASPQPQRIMELETIRRAVEAGDLLVASGGGGVPVVRDPEKGLRGIRAIIDKDLSSAMLATGIRADTIMFLTNVERISINFGKPDQREIESMTVAEAQSYLDQGQFPDGSMGPKVQGAINFLRDAENPDAVAIICHLFHAADALAGRTGTRIVKE